MSEIIDIKIYEPKSRDIFFFDNNIWMLLYCPIGNYHSKKQKEYSAFYKLILQSKASVFVNSLVLSEFCNAWLRLEFNQWKKDPKHISADYKKDFVPTETFKQTVEDIKPIVKRIIQSSHQAADDFNSINIDNIFRHFGMVDFNDSYYVELALRNGWKIVTDDRDFHKVTSSVICITAI